jgi:hypothetical protein
MRQIIGFMGKRRKIKDCKICGKPIIHRSLNAVYCKDCARQQRSDYQKTYYRMIMWKKEEKKNGI